MAAPPDVRGPSEPSRPRFIRRRFAGGLVILGSCVILGEAAISHMISGMTDPARTAAIRLVCGAVAAGGVAAFIAGVVHCADGRPSRTTRVVMGGLGSVALAGGATGIAIGLGIPRATGSALAEPPVCGAVSAILLGAIIALIALLPPVPTRPPQGP